jgi:6-pyruvoyltetrahydropterin/6-carboxytetrahydropterin synthase
MYRLEIKHNAEAAHRFFQGSCSPKCRSIHGHRWQITLTLKAEELDEQGMILEFGKLKATWRGWLDTHLDHALMLHQADPVASAVRAVEPTMRLFLTPGDPTTEAIARLLFEQAQKMLETLTSSDRVQVERVRVEETAVNCAEFYG